MNGAAGYIRLSREDGDKAESDSIGNQRKLITDYVEEKVDLVLYDIYVDDGFTGTNFKRPAFHQMIADIEKGNVNCVIVKDLSRFGRDYIDTGKYLERYFPDHNVRFISITDHIDSQKQEYDMLLPIKNIFNEQYARDISQKVHASMNTKQKAGEFIGSFASYGYRKSSKDKNKLVIDEYAAQIVRRIFHMYIEGYGKSSIAMKLNQEGIVCPSEYKRMNGLNYCNSNKLDSTSYWSYSTINSILRKEIYIGNMVQGTKHQCMRGKQKKLPKENWIVVKNTHDPVIDKDTWEKTQMLLTKRTRKTDFECNTNMFAGFLKCADCGRAMVKNTWKHADGSVSCSFCCGTYKRNGREFCTPHTMPQQVLEQVILDDLKKILNSIEDLPKLVEFQNISIEKVKNEEDKGLDNVRRELERIRKLNKSVYEDYREELISKEEFLFFREDYRKKETLYAGQIEAAEKKKSKFMTNNAFSSVWLEKVMIYRKIESLDRDIIAEMVNQIIIYENGRIKISYNFSNPLECIFSTIF